MTVCLAASSLRRFVMSPPRMISSCCAASRPRSCMICSLPRASCARRSDSIVLQFAEPREQKGPLIAVVRCRFGKVGFGFHPRENHAGLLQGSPRFRGAAEAAIAGRDLHVGLQSHRLVLIAAGGSGIGVAGLVELSLIEEDVRPGK